MAMIFTIINSIMERSREQRIKRRGRITTSFNNKREAHIVQVIMGIIIIKVITSVMIIQDLHDMINHYLHPRITKEGADLIIGRTLMISSNSEEIMATQHHPRIIIGIKTTIIGTKIITARIDCREVTHRANRERK